MPDLSSGLRSVNSYRNSTLSVYGLNSRRRRTRNTTKTGERNPATRKGCRQTPYKCIHRWPASQPSSESTQTQSCNGKRCLRPLQQITLMRTLKLLCCSSIGSNTGSEHCSHFIQVLQKGGPACREIPWSTLCVHLGVTSHKEHGTHACTSSCHESEINRM